MHGRKPGGARMNADGTSTESLTVLEGIAETEAAHEGAVSQEASQRFPFDEALLEALLEVGGLSQTGPQGGQRGNRCSAMRVATKATSAARIVCFLSVISMGGASNSGSRAST